MKSRTGIRATRHSSLSHCSHIFSTTPHPLPTGRALNSGLDREPPGAQDFAGWELSLSPPAVIRATCTPIFGQGRWHRCAWRVLWCTTELHAEISLS